MNPQFVIINSFDRSGSSFLAKIIAKHPKVECIFQPFNGSIFRREIYDEWDMSCENIEASNLINDVISGNLNSYRINSLYFNDNTTSFSLENDKLYIIKTTNFHTKIKWFNANYPSIPVWGLFREPMSILASLKRNGFVEKWYSSWAFEEILPLLHTYGLSLEFEKSKSKLEKMAFIIGVCNYIMKKNVDESQNLIFEELNKDINFTLNNFLNSYNLESFDFEPFKNEDFNIIGKKFEDNNKWLELFTLDEITTYKRIFKIFDL